MPTKQLLNKDLLALTHYQILGLKQDCGKDEIRKAFLQLSKEYHPDLNKNGEKSHQIFVRINEAYSVLNKPSSRQIYDASLLHGHSTTSWTTVETTATYDRAYWRESGLWEFRDKSKDEYYKSKPYYGIKGLQKVTNGQIVGACIVFMAVGAVFHYFFIKGSSEKAIAHLNERDRVNSKALSSIRRSATANGNHSQLNDLRARFRRNVE